MSSLFLAEFLHPHPLALKRVTAVDSQWTFIVERAKQSLSGAHKDKDDDDNY
jgi:hypothetical protein